MPFEIVDPLLAHFEKIKSYPSGWANIRLKGKTIFGLQATEIEVRAPFIDRPVLQVNYFLAPAEPVTSDNIHEQFLNPLTARLGPPLRTGNYYDLNDWRKALSPYAVVFTATWESKDVRISLSVFGGTRATENGVTAAAIYINWTDEKTAAKPLREKMLAFETEVAALLSESMAIHKFKVKYMQYPFVVYHYENEDPRAADDDPELRASQLALYRNHIIPTPQFIRNKLSNYEIAVYRIPELKKTFISKKSDTTFIPDQSPVAPIFYEVLPARGPGGREFEVNQFIIDDSKESNSLLDLVQWVERLSGVKTVMSERIDD